MAGLVMVTSTPGTTAPELSLDLPVMPPVDAICENAGAARTRSKTKARYTLRVPFIPTSIQLSCATFLYAEQRIAVNQFRDRTPSLLIRRGLQKSSAACPLLSANLSRGTPALSSSVK